MHTVLLTTPTLYVTHKKHRNISVFCLEHDLCILQDWFRANKLTLNISKSVSILFGKQRNLDLKVRIGQESIPQVTAHQISRPMD